MTPSPPIPVVVGGQTGRMATTVADAIAAAQGYELVGHWSVRGDENRGRALVTSLRDAIGARRPVVVDFTHPEQTRELLRVNRETPCPLVIGTSGLREAEMALIERAAERSPVLVAANFSLGILWTKRLLRLLSRGMPAGWRAEFLDIHHARKLDTPSATGLEMRTAWTSNRLEGPAEPTIASLRFGDGVSEHVAFVAGTGERIEIAHRLLSRTAFVAGVLDAISFVVRASPGLYSLESVYPDSGEQ